MFTPPTLGRHRANRETLHANCAGRNCGHGAPVDLDALIAAHGEGTVAADIMRRWRCTACGHLGALPTVSGAPPGQNQRR